MKTIILSLVAAITLASCSKSKEDTAAPSGVKVTPTAFVSGAKWAIALVASQSITSEGTATVEWDVYSANNQFMYDRSATISYKFEGQKNAPYVVTNVAASSTMSARNVRVVSMSGSGGYTFK